MRRSLFVPFTLAAFATCAAPSRDLAVATRARERPASQDIAREAHLIELLADAAGELRDPMLLVCLYEIRDRAGELRDAATTPEARSTAARELPRLSAEADRCLARHEKISRR